MANCPHPEKRKHENAARAWAHKLALEHDTGDGVLEIYRCRCGSWHVGHPSLSYRIKRALRGGR